MPLKGKSWNRIVLTIFAPLLILVGALGFVLPDGASLTSGAPAYNIFHLIFGAVGMACVWSGKEGLIKLFNLGFGAIDLYQAVASYRHLFPEEHFRWKPADDVLHIVIGAALVLVAIFGTGKSRPV